MDARRRVCTTRRRIPPDKLLQTQGRVTEYSPSRRRIHQLSRVDGSESEAPREAEHPQSEQLRVDFRDHSSSEDEQSEDDYYPLVIQDRPWNPQETLRRLSRRGWTDTSLHFIKTLKGWRFRFSGEHKKSPEQFLSRLRACRKATHIHDAELISSMAGIFTKEASEWYEVKQ